jgi:sacsin
MTGVNRLVHTDIENELAKRLGAKSLRYLSLVDQEMTSDLPCLSTIAVSDTLSGYGHDKEILLYNLL